MRYKYASEEEATYAMGQLMLAKIAGEIDNRTFVKEAAGIWGTKKWAGTAIKNTLARDYNSARLRLSNKLNPVTPVATEAATATAGKKLQAMKDPLAKNPGTPPATPSNWRDYATYGRVGLGAAVLGGGTYAGYQNLTNPYIPERA